MTPLNKALFSKTRNHSEQQDGEVVCYARASNLSLPTRQASVNFCHDDAASTVVHTNTSKFPSQCTMWHCFFLCLFLILIFDVNVPRLG